MKGRRCKHRETGDIDGARAKQAKMTVCIERGRASPAQRRMWQRFWQKLIAEVKAGEH